MPWHRVQGMETQTQPIYFFPIPPLLCFPWRRSTDHFPPLLRGTFGSFQHRCIGNPVPCVCHLSPPLPVPAHGAPQGGVWGSWAAQGPSAPCLLLPAGSLPHVNPASCCRCSSGFDRHREEWLSYGCGQQVRLGPGTGSGAELQAAPRPRPSSSSGLSAPLVPFWIRWGTPIET